MSTLTFFWQFNPRGNKLGGVGKYILSFLKYLRADIAVKVVGVGDESDPVGVWQNINIGGRSVSFLAVCRVMNEDYKGAVPLVVRYAMGLLRCRSELNELGVLYLQRFSYLLPLTFVSGRKIVMCHTDYLSYLRANIGFGFRIGAFFVKLFSGLFAVRVFSVSRATTEYFGSGRFFSINSVFFPTWAESFFSVVNPSSSSYSLEGAERINILMVGRLQHPKQPCRAVEILSLLPNNFRLVVAGDGEGLSEMTGLVSKYGLESRVSFLGALKHENLPSVYLKSDIYLSVSDYEGMSISLLEALQMGLPVVTTPTGASSVIVKATVNGFVSKGFEPSELAELLLKVAGMKYIENDICSSVKEFTASKIVAETASEIFC